MTALLQNRTPPFHEEQQGIALVNRRIAQIQQLRTKLRQLAVAASSRPTSRLADELSLTAFRLYEAKFMLDQLMVRLRQLQGRRAELVARTLPYGARTVVH